MGLEIHETVGVIITNPEKNLFYFQQKDETYWIKQFRMKYCLFSGQIETGEEEDFALKRELIEELNEEVPKLIYAGSHKIFDCFYEGLLEKNAKFTLYESILSTNELVRISQFPIKEGKCGSLIKKENIFRQEFMSDQNKTLKKYFKVNNINCFN